MLLPGGDREQSIDNTRLELQILEFLEEAGLVEGDRSWQCLNNDSLTVGHEFWGKPVMSAVEGICQSNARLPDAMEP
jgi:hypothetical protein